MIALFTPPSSPYVGGSSNGSNNNSGGISLKDRIHLHLYRITSKYWLVAIASGILCSLLLLSSSSNSHKEIWSSASKVGSGLRARTFGVPLPREAWSDAEYFIDRGITPASWSRTFNPPSCVHDYVTRNKILKSARPLDEWKDSFATESGCPSYPIPEGGFLFHMHWEGPWDAELELSIDSFLATQNLKAGHRLVFWHGEATPPPDSVVQRYAELAPNNFEFRILDRLEMSEGTCLMDMREWTDEEYRKEMNMKPPSLSNLSRLLILTKYGGVWLDSDVVLVRDLSDLLRAGPLAPAYYPENQQRQFSTFHHYNNHIISVGPAPSPVADKLLNTACGLGFGSNAWPSEYSFKPHMGRVLNDGLLQVCERITHCGLSVFPLSLTESETWTPAPLLKPCLTGTSDEQIDEVLQRVWIWHFRNSCDRYGEDPTTAYEKVKKRVAESLPVNVNSGRGMTLSGAN